MAKVLAETMQFTDEAMGYAAELFDHMMAEKDQVQLRLNGSDAAPYSSYRAKLEQDNPDKHFVDADLVYDYDYLSALKGAGFTTATDVPSDLKGRINDNDDFFWRDTETIGDEYEISMRVFAMTRERFIQRFAHRFDIVGKVSRLEYIENDLKEASK